MGFNGILIGFNGIFSWIFNEIFMGINRISGIYSRVNLGKFDHDLTTE